MSDLTKEDQAIDEARNELWYASNPKHNVTELEFTAFDCAWEACSAYYQKRITELEAEKAGYKKAAEYWKENYDRLRGTGKSLRGISRSEGGGDE